MNPTAPLSAAAAASVSIPSTTSPCSERTWDMSAARAAITLLYGAPASGSPDRTRGPAASSAKSPPTQARRGRPREEPKAPLRATSTGSMTGGVVVDTIFAPAAPGQGRQRSNAYPAQELEKIATASVAKRLRFESSGESSSDEEEDVSVFPAAGGAGVSLPVVPGFIPSATSFVMGPSVFSLDQDVLPTLVEPIKKLIEPVFRVASIEELTRPVLGVTEFLIPKIALCIPAPKLERSLCAAFLSLLAVKGFVKESEMSEVARLYATRQMEAVIVAYKKQKIEGKCALIAGYRRQMRDSVDPFDRGGAYDKLIVEIHCIQDDLADLIQRGMGQEELKTFLAEAINSTHVDFPTVQEKVSEVAEKWVHRAEELLKKRG